MADKKSQDLQLIVALVDFLGNSEDQTVDEVKAELKAEGIDVDASIQRLMGTVRRCSSEAKRKQLDIARQERLQREARRPNLRKKIDQLSDEQIHRRFQEIERISKGRLCVNFRDLQSTSSEDRRGILEDLEFELEQIEDGKADDDK
jgi:hypothetical protein